MTIIDRDNSCSVFYLGTYIRPDTSGLGHNK